MIVTQAVSNTKTVEMDMPAATVFVGRHRDEEGNRLVVADGKVIGTIADLRRWLDQAEPEDGP